MRRPAAFSYALASRSAYRLPDKAFVVIGDHCHAQFHAAVILPTIATIRQLKDNLNVRRSDRLERAPKRYRVRATSVSFLQPKG
jgi:hypothetical protein